MAALLKNNWFNLVSIVVMLMGLAASWSAQKANISNLNSSVSKVDNKLVNMDVKLQSVAEKVSNIEGRLSASGSNSR